MLPKQEPSMSSFDNNNISHDTNNQKATKSYRFIHWYNQLPRSRRLLLSYLVDWLVTLLALLIFVGLYALEPYQRPFSINDKSISYPFRNSETVSEIMLGVIAAVIPLVIILIIALGMRRSPHDLHHGVLGLFLSLSITMVIIIFFKITIGRHRPDFLARCQPKLPDGFNSDPMFGLFDASICQQVDKNIIKEGQRSFTSGHSAASFSGLGYLSFYISGKLHLFDSKAHLYKTFICLAPMLVALWVAISRIQDFLHHWSDVFVGGVIGLVIAYFSYRQFYPSLNHPRCHLPFSPRVKKVEQGVIRDEELGPEVTIEEIQRETDSNDPVRRSVENLV